MGGLSKLDAAVIQSRGDDIKCEAGGPSSEGKWSDWIMLYRRGEFDHPVVSTQPIFNSAEEAINRMEEVVREIRAMDSINPFQIMKESGVPEQVVGAVAEIIAVARG